MKANESLMPEDHEASLLAAYDEALAAGQPPALDEQALSSLGPAAIELRADLDCLMLLARRRPSRRAGRGNGIPVSLVGSAALTQLGRFRILCELGRGGQGVVFLAFDAALGRQVALKVPRPEALLTPDLRQRFLREAQAAAGLDHPNLVPVHEVGEDGPVCYIASAYCPGRSLAALLKEQSEPMAARSAAQLTATSAKAVHYIHSRGVLHRDLKPANILLDADGTPRITDFGLAKQLDAPADSGQTHTGAVLGTPAYMAPEQASGRSRDISTATDIYALGAILYECLTGRSPFGDDSERPLLERVVAEEPAPPRRLLPGLARDLETICLKCLDKDPRRRYSSALALAEDLENWLEHRPIAARPASARERLVKWIRRRPAAAALACVSTVAVLALLAGSLWHAQVLSHALDESDQLRREGLAREARLRDFLYVADMRLAKEAWDNGDLTQLAGLLDRHEPTELGADRRGFEWHWLRRCLGSRAGTLKAHDGALWCAAVSPDDQFLVTGDTKGNVKVWDLASLQPVVSLRGHTKEMHRVVFSRDGRTLATCGQDGTVRLWEVATWGQVGCLRGGHDGTVRSVAFSPDGTRLVSAGYDHCLVLWELPQGRAIRSWTAHQDWINDVAFAPDGRTFGSVGDDKCVRLWDADSGTQRARLPAGEELCTLAFSPDGQTLAVSGWGETIRLWDMGDLASPPVELTAPGEAAHLSFSSSGTRLAAAGRAGLVKVWDLGPGRREARLYKPLNRRGGKGRAIAFARGGKLLLAAFEDDGSVDFWNQEQLAGWETLPGLPADLGYIALSADGRRAAATVNAGKVCLLDLVSRQVEHSFDVSPYPGHVAFSPSGEVVAVGGKEKGALVWDVASRREILTLKGQGDVVLSVAFSPGGDLVATGNARESARLWEWPSGQLRATCGGHAGGCERLAFSPDGRTLAVGSGDYTVSLWDTSSGDRRGLIPGQGVMISAVAFAPDGQTLAVGGFDGIIRLWDVASGDLRATLSGHRRPVPGLAFSPDGRTLASQGDDDVLKLWHPGTAQELCTLATQFHLAHGVAFSGDGQTLVAGTTSADKKSLSSLLLWRAGQAKP